MFASIIIIIIIYYLNYLILKCMALALVLYMADRLVSTGCPSNPNLRIYMSE